MRRRAECLPYLVTSRWADTKNEKYGQGWKRWEDWCRVHPESQTRPASPFYVALYFNDLVIQGCKYGALTTAASAIRWGHVQEGLENPMDNLFVRITLEGAKRTVGKPPSNQKDPLTAEMAKDIVDTLGPHPDLIKRRTIVICLLGFSGFLRISELLAVQVKHLTFHLRRSIWR